MTADDEVNRNLYDNLHWKDSRFDFTTLDLCDDRTGWRVSSDVMASGRDRSIWMEVPDVLLHNGFSLADNMIHALRAYMRCIGKKYDFECGVVRHIFRIMSGYGTIEEIAEASPGHSFVWMRFRIRSGIEEIYDVAEAMLETRAWIEREEARRQ